MIRIAIIMLTVTAMTGCSVRPEVWERAESLCANAGGVDSLYDFNIYGNRASVLCKDGTEISMKPIRKADDK